MPEGMVNETFWEEKGDWTAVAAVWEILVKDPATWVIPSGAIFTLYARALSDMLGGKSNFKEAGRPMAD
jgi:hypothetical protein